MLSSEGLHPVVSRVPGGFALEVPEEEGERAAAALAAYEHENPPAPPGGGLSPEASAADESRPLPGDC